MKLPLSLLSPQYISKQIINYASALLRPESALCLDLHEGRHDVGHFGNATRRGVFTDAGQLAVIAWMQ